MSTTGAGMGLSGRYIGHLTNSSIPRRGPQDFAEPLVQQIPGPTPRTKFLAEALSNPTEFAQNQCRYGTRIIDFDLKVKPFSAMSSTIRFPEIRWPVEPGMMVITGGPGVGKSTVINFLRDAGYPVSDEVAAQIIEAGEYHPLKCKDTCQRKVFAGQVEVERQLVGKSGLRFLDRGLLDGEPYYMIEGAKPPAFFSDVPGNRYSLAFLLDELPFFEQNGVRFENLDFTKKINPYFGFSYGVRGIPVVRIPANGTAQDRAKMILDIAHTYEHRRSS